MNKLPTELINYIWSYDDRYKINYDNLIDNLKKYFNKSRIVDELKGFYRIYIIYLDKYKDRRSIGGPNIYYYRSKRVDNFSNYAFSVIKIMNLTINVPYYKFKHRFRCHILKKRTIEMN